MGGYPLQKGEQTMLRKLQEMILYVASESKNDPYFAATKLNKILFWADFYAYALFGKSISGETYRRLQYGPVPYSLPSAQKNLEENQRISVEERNFFGKTQKRLVALADPNLSIFDEKEIGLLDYTIKQYAGRSGSDLSEWTHTLVPWQVAQDQEEIPYYTVFATENKEVDESGLEWGRRKIIELGLA